MKADSAWKRHQFCGGASVFGTQCYIDEITQVVHCSCGKELKGLDWIRFTWWIVTLKIRTIVPRNMYGKIWPLDSTVI